jgi:hypothetical protein
MKSHSCIRTSASRLLLALVVGLLSSQVLTNAQTPAWVQKTDMNVARANHTQTELPSGRILVVGGRNGTGALSSVEIYNTDNTWSLDTTSLPNLGAVGFHSHTATLLNSGQVLVAGGSNTSGTPLATAYLYTPNSGVGTWQDVSSTFPAGEARSVHTATLLSTTDDRVLIAGGSNAAGAGKTNLLLFSPTTGFSILLAKLTTGRYNHAAVLVPGGLGHVIFAGGKSATSTRLRSVEAIYFPSELGGQIAANIPMEPMVKIRSALSMFVQNNGSGGADLVVTGGSSNGSNALATSEIFDYDVGWTESTGTANGSLITGRYYTVCVPHATGVIAISGYTGTNHLISCETRSTAGVWSNAAALPTGQGRYGHEAASLLNGKIFLTGGQTITPSYFKTCFMFE